MTDSTEEHSIQNEIRIAAARVNGLILTQVATYDHHQNPSKR